MAKKQKNKFANSLAQLQFKPQKKSKNTLFEFIFVGCVFLFACLLIFFVNESSKASYFQSNEAKARIAHLIDGSTFSIENLSRINDKELLWVIKNKTCQQTPLNKLVEGNEVYIHGKRLIYTGTKPERPNQSIQANYKALNIVHPANKPANNSPNEDYSTIHGVLEILPEFKDFDQEIALFTKEGFKTVQFKDLQVGDKVRFNNQNLIFAGHDHELFKHSSGIVNKFKEGSFQVPVEFMEKEKVLLLTSNGGKVVSIKDLKNGDSIFFNGQVMTFKGISSSNENTPEIWSSDEIESSFNTSSFNPYEVLLKTYKGYKRVNEDDLQKGDIYYKDGQHHQIIDLQKIPKNGIEPKKVTQKWCKEVDSILHITLTNGEVIGVTHEHPFATAQMVYIAARDLVPGTLLFTSKGSPVAVKSIKEIKKKTIVCGITVEGNHNYFVGKSGVLVHNDCRVRFANGKEKVIKFDEIAQLLKDGENFQIIDANVAAPNNPNNPLNQAWDKAKNGQFNPEGLTYSDSQWLEFINSAGGRDFLNAYTRYSQDINGFLFSWAGGEALSMAGFFNSVEKLFGGSGRTGTGTELKHKIQFGKTDNQIYHTFRHTDALGLDRSLVKSSIEKHFPSVASKISNGKSLNSIIKINGYNIQYSAYRLPDGTINIGRIHAVK